MAMLEIKNDGVETHVILDGKDISHMITRFSFEMDANKHELPVLKLDVLATDIVIDSVCLPEIPDVYKPFYKKREASD